MSVDFHAVGPPVGLVEVTTLPLRSSTATQRSLVGQEATFSEVELCTFVTVQAAAPTVGLLEVTTLPLSSTATHRSLLGQDTAWRFALSPLVRLQQALSAVIVVQAAAPPVG